MGYFNETDLKEELFGRGNGDPDAHGYPGDHQQPKHKTPNVYRKKHWSEAVNPFSNSKSYEPREYGDYSAASPEQNWEED